VANISRKSPVSADIQLIFDRAGALFEQYTFLMEQSKKESAHLQQLSQQSLLLTDRAMELCEWEVPRRHIKGG